MLTILLCGCLILLYDGLIRFTTLLTPSVRLASFIFGRCAELWSSGHRACPYSPDTTGGMTPEILLPNIGGGGTIVRSGVHPA